MTGFLYIFLLCHIVTGINFPGLRVPLSGPRSSIYSLESCTDVSSSGAVSNIYICMVDKQFSGATSTTPVVLAAGEGRQFTSPGYDGSTGYGNQAKCIWTFTPATGATLTFSCSAFDLTATSVVGDKCTGDFVRVYDLADGNSLDSSGERYCHTTSPAFSYSSQIQVLFDTNNDANAGTGFDCEVVASTTTTTTVAPQTSDCTTIDGPGVGKACMSFTYGSHRISYDGCINRAPPEQYVSVVPNLVAAPKETDDEEDFLQAVTEVFGSEFSTDFSDSGAISFGVAPRRRVTGLQPRQ